MKSDESREGGITARTVAYALQVIRYYRSLDTGELSRILGRQLLRSGTSVGANIHEAQVGQSRADFLCKVQIARKEAREAAYWLKLLAEERLGDAVLRKSLIAETAELLAILSSIVLTTKERTPPHSRPHHS